MLNKELIREWVADLRSGEWKQTTGRLRRAEKDDTFSYCCLGQVTEKCKGLVNGRFNLFNEFVLNDDLNVHSEDSLLPNSIVKLLGLPDFYNIIQGNLTSDKWGKLNEELPHTASLIVKYKPEKSKSGVFLSTLNDAGATFAEIADVIEENYLAS